MHWIMKHYGSYRLDDFWGGKLMASQYLAMVDLIVYEKKLEEKHYKESKKKANKNGIIIFH
jgi:hypothetical protein